MHRYEPVRERGTLRAFGLAVLTHILLLIFLYFGVQWQSSTPRGEEAELWDEAAVQQAVQQSAPVPEIKPEPVIKAPPPKVDEEADIALEQQKRKREQQAAAAREAELARRAAQERAEAQRQARLKEEQQARQSELQRKALAEQQAKEKAAADAQARKNAQLQAQAEAKAKAEADAKLKAKAAADAKLKAESERKANEARSNAQRKEQLDRLRAMAGAGATGSVAGSGGGVGNAMGTGGTASAGYAERVRAKVKPNILFDPSAVNGNPSAVVSVQMAPDGSILSKRLTKSSGNGAYDEAVLRAVERSDPLPRDTNGKAPSSVILTFRPKE